MWVLALGEICFLLQTQPRLGLIMCGQWISARRLKRGRTPYLDDCQWSCFFFIKAHTTQNSLHLQFFPQIIRVSTLTTSSTEMRKVPQLVLFLVPKSCRRNLPFVRSTKTQPALASQSAWQSSCVCPFPTCWRWEGEPLFLCVDFKIHLFAWCCKKRAKCAVFLEMLRFYLHILLNMGATWDIW